ncbi:cytidylate kinase [Raphidocelis subcapitata]|uniref:(d)CMP kinase n=1 Tax=Raphidocelis subcapitata TaxID=307507 RepID=A0A2V0NTH9_9CHLO|nr:cytidylate kinase [Raphidocelis subcapitata]|eukprot:GBF90619.1 cytidylate kinase [Raphidocelis subcapitata]
MQLAAARRRLLLPGAPLVSGALAGRAGLRSGSGSGSGAHIRAMSAAAAGAAAAAPPPLVVAIDGPAAAGKGTVARLLAERLGLAHMDTGLLYRRVAAAALAAGARLDDGPALAALASALPPLERTPEAELRSEAVSQAASKVSALPPVRAALLQAQRDFAASPPPPFRGTVLDGRDVGTVVCPAATAKLFITASPEARARRRLLELQARHSEPNPGPNAAAAGPSGPAPAPAPAPAPSLEGVLAAMRERDERDAARAVAPLAPAADALVLDTTGLGIEQALAAALAHVRAREAAAAAAGGGG